MRDALLPGLYLVATPIGNLDDLSPRAARCLAEVDVIAAEDTRIARTLLRHFGIRKPLLSYYDHNERARTPELLARLVAGGRVALVSDQGTPLLSDPGYRLVRSAAEAGVRVSPIPGPSAALAALVASGLATDRFSVLGFLPRRGGRRQQLIEGLRDEPATSVLFEAPHRVVETLRDLAEVLGERRAAVARDLTKPDEQVLRGTLGELGATLQAEPRVRGELTLVIAGNDSDEPGAPPELDRLISRLLSEGLSARSIRDVIADSFEIGRAAAYERVLAAKRRDDDGD